MRARRRGGVPPIVTVLITISAVVAAGLVAWFLFYTTSGATKQPMLEVTGAYALCSSTGTTTSCYVYITLRNMGTANVTLNQVQLDVLGVASSISCGTGSSNIVPPGGSINIRCPSAGTTGNVPDGASAALLLTVTPAGGSQQSLSIAFKIARP
jgi:P pilus assembly chaperone PapD